MSAPRVISNSSTVRGWLEANGLDDMILNPCGCIFGVPEESQTQIPIPGQRRYANQRPVSQRGRGAGGARNGQRHGGSMKNGGRGLSRQQSVMSRTSMPPLPEDADYGPEELLDLTLVDASGKEFQLLASNTRLCMTAD